LFSYFSRIGEYGIITKPGGQLAARKRLLSRKTTSRQVPTKRQRAKWERQDRIRRIIIIASTVFIIGIIGCVVGGYYVERVKPFHEKVITVNDESFNMRYYINMLDAYTRGQGIALNDTYNYTGVVAQYIEDAELMRQGAEELNATVSEEEIDQKIAGLNFPNTRAYRDMLEGTLLGGKFLEYFDSQLPAEMLQAYIQMMLVESEDVAEEVIERAKRGENFTDLVGEFSYDTNTKRYNGNVGWLPEEVMPPNIAETFNLSLGEISQPIYDNSTSKSVGYWLIRVNETDQEKGREVSAILLGSEQEAREIKGELDEGGDFGELAWNHSQHSSKYKSGELGWLKEESNAFSDAFIEAAFQLSTGQVSEPVKDETVLTKGGYWIVKVVDKQQRALDDELRTILRNEHYIAWLDLRRENSTIENKLDASRKSWAAEKVIEGR